MGPERVFAEQSVQVKPCVGFLSSRLPIIGPESITEARSLKGVPGFKGEGHHEIMEAKYGGKKVFIKISSRVEGEPIREIRKMMRMNEAGAGAKVLATYEDPRFPGIPGVVFDFIPGVIYRGGIGIYRLPENFPLNEGLADQIEDVGRKIEAAGFHSAVNVQFIFSLDGKTATFVDAEGVFDSPPALGTHREHPTTITRRMGEEIRAFLRAKAAKI